MLNSSHLKISFTFWLRRLLPAFLLTCFFNVVQAQLVAADTIKYSGNTTFCEGQSLTLTANNTTSINSFRWELGTSNSGPWTRLPTTTVSHVATATGWYRVTDTSTNPLKEYPPLFINALPKPTAGFTFTPSGQCASQPVFFSNISTGVGQTYQWTFGDPNSGGANTSSAVNPSHRFVGSTGNGNHSFNVKLLVTNSNGCKDSVTQVVTIKQSPGTQLLGNNAGIYQGRPFFRECVSAATADFTFINQSNTSNTNYRIIWGDASADYNAATFNTALTHTYSVGVYTLKFIVTGSNGCVDTTEYGVFVGTNPAVGLGNPGNTSICTGSSLTFPISNTSQNAPGTSYTVVFNDGTPPLNFQHPAPADITHLFTKTSCGTFSGALANSFSATITASNPCDQSIATVVPIRVSDKPRPDITVQPKDTVCVQNNINISATNGSGKYVTSGGCQNGTIVWNILPASGFTVVSGSLGNDNGQSNVSLWTPGTENITLRFTTPGIYTISMKMGNPICGIDDTTKVICVNPAPVADFLLDKTEGCAPLTINTTSQANTPICGNTGYSWTVSYTPLLGCVPATSSYTLLNGTTLQSANPQFQFNNPGRYRITLVTNFGNGACVSTQVFKDVTVKAKPLVTLAFASSICENQTITPIATVNACAPSTPATYAWTFIGGIPATSTLQIPGSILYNTQGNYNVSLAVTNDCGTTTVSNPLAVQPAPDVTVPPNSAVCAGKQAGPFVFTSSLSGTTFTWTNNQPGIGLASSGTGNINAFTAINNGVNPIVATITVKPNNTCPGPSKSFTITVNPTPSLPGTTTTNYCVGDVATPLTAIPTNGHTLNWYLAATGGTPLPGAPTPSTSTAGVQIWYVSQTNTSTGCEGPRAQVTVNVNPVPTFTLTSSNPTTCASATGSITLSGLLNSTSYVVQYTRNGIPQSVTRTSSNTGIIVIGSLTAAVYDNIRVTSIGCPSLPQGPVSLSDPNPPATPTASNSGPICAGNSLQLNATSTTAGVIFSWSGPNGFTSNNPNPTILNASTNASGIYSVTTSLAGCTSASSATTVIVNPTPVVTAFVNGPICETETLQFTGNALPTGSIVSWTGPNGFNSTSNNPSIPLATLAASGTYTFAASLGACQAIPATVNALVKPKPTISNAVGIQPTNCINPDGAIRIEGLTSGTSYTVTYLQNGVSQNVIMSANTVGQLTISPLPPGIYTNIRVNLNGCISNNTNDITLVSPNPPVTPVASNNGPLCVGSTLQLNASSATTGVIYTWTGPNAFTSNAQNPTIPNVALNNAGNYTVTVSQNGCVSLPATTTVSIISAATVNAGADQQLCNQTATTLAASPTGNGTGTWKVLPPATATITNVNSPTTSISGLVPGIYQLVWEVTNSVCATGTDTVIITNLAAIAGNSISPVSTILCTSQSVTLQSGSISGGNNQFNYQWQQSSNNVNWSNVANATNATLTVTPSTNTFYRRIITSGTCKDTSNTAEVIVQAAISNNTIAANQSICINTIPAAITGSIPAGGGGGVIYAWELSIDGGITWQSIPNAIAANYQPTVLTQTTLYRRLVTTSLCAGPQSSTSNIVTITVNPNAQAILNVNTPLGCSPFVLTAQNISVQHIAAKNSTYNWYVNNQLIGTGINFPGYTLIGNGVSANLKVVAISRFGCLPDSASATVSTVANPLPTFTLSDTVGCGPLTVTITNTTPNANTFTYLWNFGNGQTSTAQNPGAIFFDINPNRGDTIYTVTLKATAGCDTLSTSQQIRVRSRPRALFTPSSSIGCSPMTVTFNNNSAGSNASFEWDFGDGSPRIQSSAQTLTHTYFTGVLDTFIVRLFASNDCGTDTAKFAIVVNPNSIRLDMAVNGNELNGCAPHTVRFINNTTGANRFTWTFGDGTPPLITTKGFDTVVHTFSMPGVYTVTLFATNGCSDTSTTETITVVQGPTVSFTALPSQICLGDSIMIINSTTETLAWQWDFGDGTTSNLRQPKKFYNSPGTYRIVLSGTKIFPQGFGCTDSAVATIIVNAPTGSFTYRGGFYCESQSVLLEVLNSNGNRFIYYPGNGDSVVSTATFINYQYPSPGKYVPSVKIFAGNCSLILRGTDTVLVDRIKAGFRYVVEQQCGITTVRFTDTSRVYLGATALLWNFGDGTTATIKNVTKPYYQAGVYRTVLRIRSVSGCEDSVIQNIDIPLQSIPAIAIQSDSVACTGNTFIFSALTNTPGVITYNWNFGNGQQSTGTTVTTRYFNTGTYTVTMIGRTAFGCADTVYKTITVKPSPTVIASNNSTICLGQSTSLLATGTITYTWSPQQGLSCFNCANPIATPTQTTSYVVTGTNQVGCSVNDTVLITVMQPFRISVSPNDTICFPQNESAQLFASGAKRYVWSPAVGLSATNIPNPVARSTSTTTYRVIGFDDENCFTDTAFVTVAVGYLPTLELGTGSTVTAGTQITLNPTITNGPIKRYTWTPNSNLSCNNCATPVATINNDVLYRLNIETFYGCTATDTISYKVLCKENEQVYVPNAFSPDGDGINDVLMVRGKGLSQVKSFIIFNRWGQVVFEQQNFAANDPSKGWNGIMKNTGTKAAQDVYVYRVESICTAGGTFIQSGNVTLFYMR